MIPNPIATGAMLLISVTAAHAATLFGPATDRVGRPDYANGFIELRRFYGAERQRVGTVYANGKAASVTNLGELPYPDGSIFVVEWRRALMDGTGTPLRDAAGYVRGGEVTQIDVMRSEAGYGADYRDVRTGNWEFVSYRPDGSHFVAPAQSSQCAACHVAAGTERDFVFRGRFPLASDHKMMGN
jgi:hypothetical protein